MDLSFLPAVNASLNALAGALLVTGWAMIRRRRIAAHRNCMMAAFAASCLFLASYLAFHWWRTRVMGLGPTPFPGGPGARKVYLAMLASHSLLAAAVPFLAVTMLYLGLRRRDAVHRRLGRVTLPIWLYVSVTGVLIYLALYHYPV